MVDLKKRFSNPLILSVLISLVTVYSFAGLGKVPVKNQFVSVLPLCEISELEGLISSSPAKTSKGNYYSASLNVYCSKGKKADSTSFGTVKVFFPSKYIESFFPGKLYSESGKKIFIETGSKVKIKGSFSGNLFFVEEVLHSDFDKTGFGFVRWIRAKGRLKFKRMLFSWGEAGGLLLALLSGSREYTNPEVSSSFRNAGLSHVLALSGMHLSLFSGIALFLGERIGRKKIALILQLAAISLFVWFAGFSPSLFRAFICVSVTLFQRIISVEKSDMLTVLSFSFFVQSLIFPDDLMNTGFILSYGALAGILIFGEFFRKVLSFVMPGKIASAFAASTGAQLVTMPVSAGLFKMVTPIGIVSSVFVSPLVTLFIYSGLVFIILGLMIPGLVSAGEFFMKIQYNLIVNLVGGFSRIPPLSFDF